jgi:hypothetical protein
MLWFCKADLAFNLHDMSARSAAMAKYGGNIGGTTTVSLGVLI